MSKIDMRDGSLRGRLAGMVGASWKGIQYVRKMVIPANPNTVAQQGTRTVFSYLVETGRRINSTILKSFILPKPKKSSPFNEFISRNKSMISNGVIDKAALIIGTGSLYLAPITNVTLVPASNIVTIEWTGTLQGEALDTDSAIIVSYNETQDLYGFATTATRVDETDDVALAMTAGDKVFTYIFFVQGTDLSSITEQDESTA